MSIASDGEVTDEEMKLTVGIAKDLPPFAGKPIAEVEASVGEAFERFASDGRAARMEALRAASLDPEARREVLMAAALVMLADGGIGKDEEAFTAELAKTLGATDEERAKVLSLVTSPRSSPR